jgi:U3 small nucleolar RNA-associated protein 11
LQRLIQEYIVTTMSSLRNAVKRITHKERSQPQHRSHLGILEKKKDYKERAVQYHKKEDRINVARKKAAFRNPDEFYFGMNNAQITDGKHRKTIEAEQKEFEAKVGTDTIRIMKDQDLSYIRMQKQKDLKKIERLQSSLHFIDYSNNNESTSKSTTKKRKHTIFVDTKEEAENFDEIEHFDIEPEFVGSACSRPKKEALRNMALIKVGCNPNNDDTATSIKKPTMHDLVKISKQTKKDTIKAANARAASYAEMEARTKRVGKLQRAEAHLVTEKLLASKGRKRKIIPAENGMPAVYKWRRKRQG